VIFGGGQRWTATVVRNYCQSRYGETGDILTTGARFFASQLESRLGKAASVVSNPRPHRPQKMWADDMGT